MRRTALIAGCCVSLGLGSGCAGIRLRREDAAETPAIASRRQEMSQAATTAMTAK